MAQLAPASVMEETHATEILNATWRLHRCANLEAELAEEKAHENLEDEEARPCPICQSSRLNEVARNVFLQGETITSVAHCAAASNRLRP